MFHADPEEDEQRAEEIAFPPPAKGEVGDLVVRGAREGRWVPEEGVEGGPRGEDAGGWEWRCC